MAVSALQDDLKFPMVANRRRRLARAWTTKGPERPLRKPFTFHSVNHSKISPSKRTGAAMNSDSSFTADLRAWAED